MSHVATSVLTETGRFNSQALALITTMSPCHFVVVVPCGPKKNPTSLQSGEHSPDLLLPGLVTHTYHSPFFSAGSSFKELSRVLYMLTAGQRSGHKATERPMSAIIHKHDLWGHYWRRLPHHGLRPGFGEPWSIKSLVLICSKMQGCMHCDF